jgi:hypothetical protein
LRQSEGQHMKREGETLHDRARRVMQECRASYFNWVDLYNAGWHNHEFTCAACGTMIGKNLNGQAPYDLAVRHVRECAKKGKKNV